MSEWAFRTLVAMTREVANPFIDVGAFLEVGMPIGIPTRWIVVSSYAIFKKGSYYFVS